MTEREEGGAMDALRTQFDRQWRNMRNCLNCEGGYVLGRHEECPTCGSPVPKTPPQPKDEQQ